MEENREIKEKWRVVEKHGGIKGRLRLRWEGL